MRTVRNSGRLLGGAWFRGVSAHEGVPGPGGVSQHAMWQTPPVNRMTDGQV